MSTTTNTGRFVHANGIDIHYLEAGAGQPLVLLNNGMISTNPIWADWPSSYTAYRATLAERFRVIEPDFRGSGRTVHPGGPIPYDLLADDVLALIDALSLRAPHIGGYGDGGVVATIVGIRAPEAVRAIVNHGGYDLFNPDPQAPALVMTRQMLGGRPDATQADPDAISGSEFEFLRRMAQLMQADHDAAQGAGHWKTVLSRTFDRVSQPAGYTFEELAAITAPTLVLVGDRDRFCTVEEGTRAYRALRHGEFSVLPGTAAGNTPLAVRTAIEFLERHAA